MYVCLYVSIYIYICVCVCVRACVCVCVCVGGGGIKVLNAVVAELGISEGIKQDASILCYSEFRA